MNLRRFIANAAGTALASSWSTGQTLAETKATAVTGQATSYRKNGRGNGLTRHRFGVNYTPSSNWWFCWNDWHVEPIQSDLEAIAALGADHLRIFIVWPFFQPNPGWVSPAHLDRLDQLLAQMGQRGLDAVVTVFTGQLSGLRFYSIFKEQGSAAYTDPRYWKAQELLVHELARVMKRHDNIIGFDFGNEMETCWKADLPVGDAWMARMFALMNSTYPGGLHVNGTSCNPWFTEDTFSPRALAACPLPVMHSYPHWSNALKYGGPMDPPSIRLLDAFAALIRSYAGSPQKPVWAGEYNTCIVSMPERQQAEWFERTTTSAIQSGVCWFTYWDSHDTDPRFIFNATEYSLGLFTNDGRLKEQGKVFKRLVAAHQGKPVVLLTASLPPPPASLDMDTTWKWMLEYLQWKPARNPGH